MADTLAALYVNPANHAAQTAAATADPVTKRVMTKLAAAPTASWFGDWNQDIKAEVQIVAAAAASAQRTPVLVAYNIPGRDLGNYSAGGASTSDKYKTWIRDFAAGIGLASAIVILEPDALAQLNQLPKTQQTIRYELLHFAINTLKANPRTKVYVDAGHPDWIDAADMAHRLLRAGIPDADGFSLNVSNFISTRDNVAYGSRVAALVGNTHFVIDTSRNGNGSNGEWCNPSGRALGIEPTADTGNDLIDFYLWIKVPGESDGTCNGGPAAGEWWPTYAEALALSAGW